MKALREVVALPSTYDALTSDATANGTFTWDGRTFKSNWALAPARWGVPYGDQTLQLQGDARLWVKYEGGARRADAPHVALRMNGIDWSGKVERILLIQEALKPQGKAAWSGRMLI